MKAIVTLSLTLLLIAACSVSGRMDWEKIKGSNDRTQYYQFIKEYPKSLYAKQAKSLLDSLDWSYAKEIDTIDEYNNYAFKHPQGLYLSENRQRLSTLEWNSILQDVNLTTLASYINRYPDEPQSTDAKLMADSIAFSDFLKMEDPVALFVNRSTYKPYLTNIHYTAFLKTSKDSLEAKIRRSLEDGSLKRTTLSDILNNVIKRFDVSTEHTLCYFARYTVPQSLILKSHKDIYVMLNLETIGQYISMDMIMNPDQLLASSLMRISKQQHGAATYSNVSIPAVTYGNQVFDYSSMSPQTKIMNGIRVPKFEDEKEIAALSYEFTIDSNGRYESYKSNNAHTLDFLFKHEYNNMLATYYNSDYRAVLEKSYGDLVTTYIYYPNYLEVIKSTVAIQNSSMFNQNLFSTIGLPNWGLFLIKEESGTEAIIFKYDDTLLIANSGLRKN